MAQIKPIAVDVGSKYKDLDIGYTIKAVDNKVYSKFTTKSVFKSDIPDIFYSVATVPTNGGFIVWGTKDLDLFFDTIDPSFELPDFNATLDKLYAAIKQLVIPNPDIVNVVNVDTSEFLFQVKDVKSYVLNALSDSSTLYSELVKELCIKVDDLTANYNKWDIINNAAEQQAKLENLRNALNEFMVGKSYTINTIMQESDIEPIVDKLTTIANEKIKIHKQNELSAINKFLDSLGEV